MAAVMAHTINKRKRDPADVPNIRSAPGLSAENNDFTQQYLNDDATDTPDAHVDFASVLAQDDSRRSGQTATDTASAALAQYHTMTVPQPTEQAFLAQSGEGGDDHRASEAGAHRGSTYSNEVEFAGQPTNGDASPTDLAGQTSGDKPAVGTDAWHRIRRDNHKEVERRRRETINEGINELAKIVPGCEKNKGSILARAVQFITQLKENEAQNIEKWTLEKMLTEQAIAELSTSCDKLKTELSKAWTEMEQWKRAAQKAGADIEIEHKNDSLQA